MSTEQNMASAISKGKLSPYRIAQIWYAKYSDVSFEEDFNEYLENGCVIVRPTIFAMGTIVYVSKDEPAWFIRFACGNLKQLWNAMPIRLPRVIFCRRKGRDKAQWKLVNWSFDRMAALIAKKEK